MRADPILPSSPGLEDPLEELDELEGESEDEEELEEPFLPLLYPAFSSLPTALAPLTATPAAYPAPRTIFLPIFLTAVFTFSNLSFLILVS